MPPFCAIGFRGELFLRYLPFKACLGSAIGHFHGKKWGCSSDSLRYHKKTQCDRGIATPVSRWGILVGSLRASVSTRQTLAHRNRSDFCDLRLRCPSRTPDIARFPRQETAMMHCDLRVRWQVASDLRFQAAISEPQTPSCCGIPGDLAPSTRKSLAIAIVRFWCAKRQTKAMGVLDTILLWFPPAICSLIFLPCLTYSEWYIDELFAVLRNADARGETPLAELFRNDFWGNPLLAANSWTHKSYRPLAVLSFAGQFKLLGDVYRPEPLRAFNVAVHTTISIMVAQFLHRWGCLWPCEKVPCVCFGSLSAVLQASCPIWGFSVMLPVIVLLFVSLVLHVFLSFIESESPKDPLLSFPNASRRGSNLLRSTPKKCSKFTKPLRTGKDILQKDKTQHVAAYTAHKNPILDLHPAIHNLSPRSCHLEKPLFP